MKRRFFIHKNNIVTKTLDYPRDTFDFGFSVGDYALYNYFLYKYRIQLSFVTVSDGVKYTSLKAKAKAKDLTVKTKAKIKE